MLEKTESHRFLLYVIPDDKILSDTSLDDKSSCFDIFLSAYYTII